MTSVVDDGINCLHASLIVHSLPVSQSKKVKPLSTLSGVVNLLNAIWGAGILALPYSVLSGGLVVTSALLVAVALLTYKSINYLTECVTLLRCHCMLHGDPTAPSLGEPSCGCGHDESCNENEDGLCRHLTSSLDSYEKLAHRLFGWAGVLAVSFAFTIGGWGMLLASFIFIVQCLITLFTDVSLTTTDLAHSQVFFFVCLIMVAYFIIFPLALIRDLNKLRFVAYVTIFATVYLCLVLCFFLIDQCIGNLPQPEPSSSWAQVGNITVMPPSVNGLLSCASILMTSFSCHIAILPVFTRLKRMSPSIMKQSITIPTLVICFITYAVISFSGAFLFGTSTDVNILNNLNSLYFRNGVTELSSPSVYSSTYLLIRRVCIRLATYSTALSLVASSPLLIWPVRSCIMSLKEYYSEAFNLQNGEEDTTSATNVTANRPQGDDGSSSGLASASNNNGTNLMELSDDPTDGIGSANQLSALDGCTASPFVQSPKVDTHRHRSASDYFLSSFRRPVFASDRVAADFPGDSPLVSAGSSTYDLVGTAGLTARGRIMSGNMRSRSRGSDGRAWQLSTLAIVSIVVFTAIMCPSVETAFRIVGVVAASFIIFIFPPALWLKALLGDNSGCFKNFVSVLWGQKCARVDAIKNLVYDHDRTTIRQQQHHEQGNIRHASSMKSAADTTCVPVFGKLVRNDRLALLEATAMIIAGFSFMYCGLFGMYRSSLNSDVK